MTFANPLVPTFDLQVPAGVDYTLAVNVIGAPSSGAPGEAINLTGYTFASNIMDAPGGTVLASFTVGTADLANGIVTFSLSGSELLPDISAYDIEVTTPTDDTFILVSGTVYGLATVTP